MNGYGKKLKLGKEANREKKKKRMQIISSLV